MKSYLTKCNKCGLTTSVKYARTHQGQCKACTTGNERPTASDRQARIIDQGWEGYAREEGHYDTPY